MKYTGKTCPICNIPFKDGDDVVVCPECGTPHHRACYDKNGECAYNSLHGKEDFNKEAENSTDSVICPYCNTANSSNALSCVNCGAPLNGDNNSTSSPFGATMFDPMAGISPDEPFEDNITAGEAAKYVKVNTPYYIRIFNSISKNGRSKFNFAALIFPGAWMLYRKQYLKGAIITVIVALLMIGSTFMTYTYSGEIIDEITQSTGISSSTTDMQSSVNSIVDAVSALPFEKKLIYWMPIIMDIARYIIGIVLGFTANRAYYKHCMKKIKEIKELEGDNAAASSRTLQTSGGVNTKIVFCLLACHLIITYLPIFLS